MSVVKKKNPWTTEKPLPNAISGAQCIVLNSKYCLFLGGYNECGIYKFNVRNSKMTCIASFPKRTPYNHHVVALYNPENPPKDGILSFLSLGGTTNRVSSHHYTLIKYDSNENMENCTFSDFQSPTKFRKRESDGTINESPVDLPLIGTSTRALYFESNNQLLIIGGNRFKIHKSIVVLDLSERTFQIFQDILPKQHTRGHVVYTLSETKEKYRFMFFADTYMCFATFDTIKRTFDIERSSNIAYPECYGWFQFSGAYSRRYNKIVCFGGLYKLKKSDTRNKYLDTIRVFDMDLREWWTESKCQPFKMPYGRYNMGALHIEGGCTQRDVDTLIDRWTRGMELWVLDLNRIIFAFQNSGSFVSLIGGADGKEAKYTSHTRFNFDTIFG